MTMSFDTTNRDTTGYRDPVTFGPLPLWCTEFFFQSATVNSIASVLKEVADRVDFLVPAYVLENEEGATLCITRLPRTSAAKQGSEKEFTMLSALLLEKFLAAGLLASEKPQTARTAGMLLFMVGLLRGSADSVHALPALGFKEDIQKLAGVNTRSVEIIAFGESRIYREPALLVQLPESSENIQQMVTLARAAGQEKFSMQRLDSAQSFTVVL